jgi:dCTP deaminase
MILSDNAIMKLVASGDIEVIPALDKSHVRPVGIRMHLAHQILIPEPGQIVDPTMPVQLAYKELDLPEDGYVLEPGSFVLGSTYEKIRTPNDIVGHLEGRSTIARLGLSIHCTSGIIDSMYDEPRSIVLEMKNQGVYRIILKYKMPIGMLLLSKMTCAVQQSSQDQYRNQTSVVAPNLMFQPKKII